MIRSIGGAGYSYRYRLQPIVLVISSITHMADVWGKKCDFFMYVIYVLALTKLLHVYAIILAGPVVTKGMCLKWQYPQSVEQWPKNFPRLQVLW